MGQLVLGVAGAVAGSFIPGVGPGLGFAIGSAIGGQMFGPKAQTIRNQPQPLIDLKVTGTEYGQPIPYVRGAAGIAGQVWWNSDRRPTTTVTTSGGGGGKGGGGGQPIVETTTITYDIDLLLGLADDVIVGIARIWDNGKLIYTADGSASAGSITASASAELWERMTVYTGAADQLPDPDYEAAVGSANAPAYRGRGTVFIKGLKLGQSGQLRNLTFEVVVDGTVGDGGVRQVAAGTSSSDVYSVNVDTSAAGLPLDGKIWFNHQTGTDNIALLDANDGTILTTVPAASFPGAISAVEGVGSDGAAFVRVPSSSRIYHVAQNGALSYFSSARGGYGFVEDSAGDLWALDTGGAVYRLSAIDYGAHTCTETVTTGGFFGRLLRNAAGISNRIYGVTGGNNIGYINTFTLDVTEITSGSTISQVPPPVVGPDGYIYSMESGTLKKRDQDGALVGSLAITGGTAVGVIDHNGFAWCTGTAGIYKVNTITMLTDSIVPASGFSDGLVEVFTGVPAYYSGAGFGKVGVIEALARVTIVPPTVASVVSALCQRAGLSAGQIDVTALSSITRKVRSLALSQVAPARQALELLASTYFFEAVTSDKIYFRPRGGSAVATIPYLDLGASAGDEDVEPLALRQVNDLEIPAQIALTYINISDDYQSDTQNSDRLISAVAGTVSAVQMAIGMTPSEAKAVADTMLLDQAASIISTSPALLGDYCRLEPTDPVNITGPDGSVFRMRLVKKTDRYPLLQFEAVLDDVSVLTSQGITSADYAPGTVVAPAVDTDMELLDIPILQDIDSDAGFYVAAKGAESPWSGSAIFYSQDNVDYTRKASVMEAAVFGVCTTTLGNWIGPRIFDEKSSVTVNVGAGTLASSTRDAILGSQAVNAMLIGSEIIQFRTAMLLSTGVYKLSGLLRGSRGTEWAMTGHAASERCVALTVAGLRRILLQNSELGLSRYYKAVTLGRPLSSADAEQFTDNAIGLKPFSPFDLRAARDASNNITFTWQRRSRLSVRMIGALGISVPLGEDAEAYEVEIYSDGTYATLLRTIVATSSTAPYSAAQQTADGLTPGATVYAKVFQRSAVVGRGYPLEAAA